MLPEMLTTDAIRADGYEAVSQAMQTCRAWEMVSIWEYSSSCWFPTPGQRKASIQQNAGICVYLFSITDVLVETHS